MRAWQSSDLFLTAIPPPLECAWRLMTARTRRVSQTIIEVEANWVDDSITGDRRQATLLIAERGAAANSYQKITIVGSGLLDQQGLNRLLAPVGGGSQSATRNRLVLWPFLVQHEQGACCSSVIGV